MGRQAWALIDQSSEIEIVETNKKDAYLVYDKRIDRAEKGMSKRVLGSTMVVDNGSSHSQSKVHAEVTESLVTSDKREIEFTINEDLIPFLIKHGYPLEGKEFKWDESEKLSLKEQAEIDKWLVDYFDIDIEYFKKKYNSSIVGLKKPTKPEDEGK
jgi:phage gp29-like protein